jgi:hypothetical protein
MSRKKEEQIKQEKRENTGRQQEKQKKIYIYGFVHVVVVFAISSPRARSKISGRGEQKYFSRYIVSFLFYRVIET